MSGGRRGPKSSEGFDTYELDDLLVYFQQSLRRSLTLIWKEEQGRRPGQLASAESAASSARDSEGAAGTNPISTHIRPFGPALSSGTSCSSASRRMKLSSAAGGRTRTGEGHGDELARMSLTTRARVELTCWVVDDLVIVFAQVIQGRRRYRDRRRHVR